MGGTTTVTPRQNDVWYSTNGTNWTQATAAANWLGRSDFVAIAFDNRMWVMGGTPDAPSGMDVWHSANGVNWTLATAAAAWVTRHHFTGWAFDGRMWMAGGNGATSNQNDVWYSTDGANWTAATTAAAWPGRYGLRSTSHDGKMWISGGTTGSSEVWYSTDGAAWTAATTTAWPGRAWHEFQTLDNKMWVMGGAGNDVWSSADGANWTQQTANAEWEGRTLFASAAFDDRLWVMASAGGFSSDVWYSVPCESPTIDTHPQTQTVCESGAAAFSVTATGANPLSYQWRKDGGDMSGETGDTLTIDPVGSGDAGDYDVVVTNACGSATSSAATLTVLGGSDCNSNGSPDECDVFFGTSGDCDGDEVPDDCEEDCDGNDTPDKCEAGSGVFTWTGSDGGSFSDGNNWTPSGGPGPSGRAALSNSAASDNRAVVDDGSLPQVCFVDISASGSGRQILQVNQDFVLSTFSGISVSAGGELDLRGGEVSGGTIVNTSNTVRGHGVISADIDNQGLLQGRLGRLLELTGSTTANQSSGTVLASFAALIDIQSASVMQEGEMRIETLGGLHFDGPVTNSAGGSIEILGGSLGATTLTNEPGASLIGTGDIQANVVNDGAITAIADLQIFGNLQNDGTILIQNGVLTVTGSVSGSGVIIGGFGG